MSLNYEEVPNTVVTGKDLDYLSDMFNWNYGALKSVNNSKQNVNDQDLLRVLEKSEQLFDENLNSILRILESRGEE